ncbi:MAG TPA: STAS domain-containing protein [Actinomycetota bacterium]|nr:STAS domain-containing protein [Actinomycetota bacterium]
MNVVHRRGPDEIVFWLEGEIDLANAGTVDEEIRAALDDTSRIVIDLSRTEYIDSAGLRLLFSLARTVGERLSIVLPEESPLQRVVAMVGLPQVVTLRSEPAGEPPG